MYAIDWIFECFAE